MLLSCDLARISKDLEVMAHGRLEERDRFGEVADTGFAVFVRLDPGDKAQPHGVGQCLEDPCQLNGASGHKASRARGEQQAMTSRAAPAGASSSRIDPVDFVGFDRTAVLVRVATSEPFVTSELVGRPGLDPGTLGLKVPCSSG
jgi:hypothetical protein